MQYIMTTRISISTEKICAESLREMCKDISEVIDVYNTVVWALPLLLANNWYTDDSALQYNELSSRAQTLCSHRMPVRDLFRSKMQDEKNISVKFRITEYLSLQCRFDDCRILPGFV